MQTRKTLKVMFTLLIGIFLVGAGISSATLVTAQETEQSVWEVIQANDDLSDFAAWLEAAGLGDNLDRDGPFTVFAPTNAAMAEFEAQAASVTANRTQILLYHIVNGRYNGSAIANFSARPTLLGEQLNINVNGGQIMLNEAINVTTTDINAANGVVHIVDTILLPPTNSLLTATQGSRDMTLDEVLAEDGRFTTFLARLEQAGLLDDLANAGQNYTVFAPTDAAFDELTEDQVDAWLNDPDELETLLSYHLVGDQLGINQIATDEFIPTVEGRSLFVSVDENDRVFINGRPLDEVNIVAANGVIHVVETFLTP